MCFTRLWCHWLKAESKQVLVSRLLVVVDLVQDGTHEDSHDSSKDEASAVVGDVAPVADPKLPEDHAELGEVGLGVLVLERQGLAALLGNAQLLYQLLILPAEAPAYARQLHSRVSEVLPI